jgi:hypothetical protein
MIRNNYNRPERDTTRYCPYISFRFMLSIFMIKNPDANFKNVLHFRKVLFNSSGT